MEKKRVIVDRNGKAVVPFSFPPAGTYPGDYFEQHKAKPKVTIVRYPYAPDDIAAHVLECIEDTPCASGEMVNFLIYSQLTKMEATLDSDWTSFDVQVGKAGDIITPLSLLDVTLDESSEQSSESLKTSSRKYSAALAMYYIFAPVLLDTPHENYKTGLMKKMEAAVPGRQLYKPQHHKRFAVQYSNLMYNSTYKKLVAALDMFLVRFPDHPSSKLRVGTSPARYMHCCGVESLLHFSTLLEIPIQQVPEWLWHGFAEREAQKLLSPKNEIEVPFSYAPYFSFLALGVKSISKVALNATFHLYVHIVGTVLGSTRSKNARVPRDACMNAHVSALTVGAIKALIKQQQALAKSVPEEDQDDVVMAFIKAESENFPTDMNAAEWYKLLRVKQMANKFASLGLRLAQRATDVRSGTVGEMCQKLDPSKCYWTHM